MDGSFASELARNIGGDPTEYRIRQGMTSRNEALLPVAPDAENKQTCDGPAEPDGVPDARERKHGGLYRVGAEYDVGRMCGVRMRGCCRYCRERGCHPLGQGRLPRRQEKGEYRQERRRNDGGCPYHVPFRGRALSQEPRDAKGGGEYG